MNKKYFLGGVLSLVIGFSFAQDADNLVPNPSFESTKGKLKNIKQLNKAVDWFSPTGLRADLFSANIKSGLPVSVPLNKYGTEKPMEGENYAGITAYSYNNRVPRTYLLTPLTQKLKKGQKYCVKYNVSLSDLSKYATNNLGVYLTKKAIEIEGKKDIVFGEKETVTTTPSNRIYEARYNWEAVCGEFEAKGGEKYLIIGNFAENKDTKYKKLKRIKDIRGSQVPMAYYYVDNVSVKVLTDENRNECQCEVKEEKETVHVIYSKQSTSMDGFSDEDKVKNSTVYFDHVKSTLETDAKSDLDKLAELLIDNPSFKLKITGHSTDEEAEAAKMNELYSDLSERRIKKIIDYLGSHGIDSDRFEKEDVKNTEKADTSGTDLAKAKNRRVTFQLL